MSPTLLAGCFAVVTGCAYRTPAVHIPESAPFSSVKLDPHKVTVVDAKGRDVDPDTVADVRAEMRKLLAKAGRKGGEVEGTARARIVMHFDSDLLGDCCRTDGMAVLVFAPYIPFIVLGADDTEARVSVDLTLETDGRTCEGHGDAEERGSPYAPARRRALASALDDALADAASRGCHYEPED
jgi:hypothetical protein